MKKVGRIKKSSDRTYQFKICLWIALNKEDKQIQDLLRDRLNIDMSIQNINDNYRRAKKWRPIISYLRTRYLRNISRIPIAKKEYRVAMLQESLEEALTWHTKSVSQYGRVEEKKIGIIPSLIKEARIEIEGEKPLIDQSQHFHITNFKEFVEDAYRHNREGTENTSRLPI